MTQKPKNCKTMDSCQGVEREVNKVQDKFHTLGEINHHSLEEALQLVRVAKEELREGKEAKKVTRNRRVGQTLCPFLSFSFRV